ncbi:Hypothetical protein PHPALM_37205 [Phytophthora palmivora]|uniref:PiggyBac transposable element-derived protein domain-containing protein n=1 Tax=Phytophthora palmivora TaxID=4796 RepID=A0A2P4WY07_9STRA|nr:Hypothetical protein PHPALM_37205 [Phytophthora palmivora]
MSHLLFKIRSRWVLQLFRNRLNILGVLLQQVVDQPLLVLFNPPSLLFQKKRRGRWMVSDCEDTETEFCFVDDDDELELGRRTSDGGEIYDDDEDSGDSDIDVEVDGRSSVHGIPVRTWSELDKRDMANFAKSADNMTAMRASGWTHDPGNFPPDQRYPNLYSGDYGPTEEVLKLSDSPLKLTIAEESNRYFVQNLTARVDKMFEKQHTPGRRSKEWFLQREAKKAAIVPHELLHVIGLLIARMLNPHHRHFRDHWGQMPRGRFRHIMANLHFTNNAKEKATTDRAWKVRSIVDTLQQTFPLGYSTPPVISFDEESQEPNPPKLEGKIAQVVDQVIPDMLRKYGLFHAEVGNVPESQRSADPNTGPSAVIRNLEAVLPRRQDDVFHLVVTDRFYTSVQLSFQLLERNVYSIGTIMGDRLGYPREVVEKNRDRPKSIPHGTTRIAVAKNCPGMTDLVWWDRKPVQFLATGSSRTIETCQRRTRASRGVRQDIPCPSIIRDYHRWMGGVDSHDQLRLQRYSLQMQTWLKNYYKAIFMGLVDIAIVNAYIVFREAQKASTERPITHAEFLLELHTEMLGLRERDFAESPDPEETADGEVLPPLPPGHQSDECPEYQVVHGVRKRRQRQCKVCSILKRRVGERRATKYYCAACSTSDKARVWPQHYPGNLLTCSQIWHYKWNNGAKRPIPRCGRGIQSRESGGSPGKRKRRASGEGEDNEGDEGEENAEDTESVEDAESVEDVEDAEDSEDSEGSEGAANTENSDNEGIEDDLEAARELVAAGEI